MKHCFDPILPDKDGYVNIPKLGQEPTLEENIRYLEYLNEQLLDIQKQILITQEAIKLAARGERC